MYIFNFDILGLNPKKLPKNLLKCLKNSIFNTILKNLNKRSFKPNKAIVLFRRKKKKKGMYFRVPELFFTALFTGK